jgi:thioredoxin 1
VAVLLFFFAHAPGETKLWLPSRLVLSLWRRFLGFQLFGSNYLVPIIWFQLFGSNYLVPSAREEGMLNTNLNHLADDEQLKQSLNEHDNVIVCYGRMGPMCLPVYDNMEKLQSVYTHVAFFDMDFDEPGARYIRELPQVEGFMGLPFIVYFRQGVVVAATAGIQTRFQITDILDKKFGPPSP